MTRLSQPAFQHSTAIHYTSLLSREQFPQRTTDLITLCKAAWRNAGKSPGVRIQLWGSGARPAWGQDSQTPGGGPGAPQPQAPPHLGSVEAAPGWAAREAPIHPGLREEATLRAGCHSCKIKMLESAFPKCEEFQDQHSAASPGAPGPRDAGLAGPRSQPRSTSEN